KKILQLSPDARKILYQYAWPGNVRELRNCIESMVVVSAKTILDIEEIPEHIYQRTDKTLATPGLIAGMTIDDVERELIKITLITVNGNREEAAKMLGIGERTLYRKLDLYGLK
ncbi:MAG: helix-turn-helix domain-containing protein, partial [Planctomycetota bacterium]